MDDASEERLGTPAQHEYILYLVLKPNRKRKHEHKNKKLMTNEQS